MELDQVEEVLHDVRDVGELIAATVMLAPSINSIILDLLLRLEAFAGQNESHNVLR